jgi:hypothetical protein
MTGNIFKQLRPSTPPHPLALENRGLSCHIHNATAPPRSGPISQQEALDTDGPMTLLPSRNIPYRPQLTDGLPSAPAREGRGVGVCLTSASGGPPTASPAPRTARHRSWRSRPGCTCRSHHTRQSDSLNNRSPPPPLHRCRRKACERDACDPSVTVMLDLWDS